MAEVGLAFGASAEGETPAILRAGIRRASAVFGTCDGVIVPMLDTDRQRVSEYIFTNNEASSLTIVVRYGRPNRGKLNGDCQEACGEEARCQEAGCQEADGREDDCG